MSTLPINLPHPARAKILDPREKQMRKQAQKLVSQTFYGTMLKQMRESPFKSKLFDGGRGGEAFSSLLDQHLADRMAGASRNKLSDAIVHRLMKINPSPAAAPSSKQISAASMLKQAGKQQATPVRDWRGHVPADLRA